MTNDMTKGNPLKIFIYFTIPLLIGNIFQQLYSMVDTIIVGRFVGVDALAAVGSPPCKKKLLRPCSLAKLTPEIKFSLFIKPPVWTSRSMQKAQLLLHCLVSKQKNSCKSCNSRGCFLIIILSLMINLLSLNLMHVAFIIL